jgi:hypothetical protein
MTNIPGTRFLLAALCAFALASAALMLPAPAGSGRASAKGRAPGDWSVLAPVSYKNLTIFPVRARDAVAHSDYITLDEGTKNGTVVITEKGAGAPASARRRPRPLPNGTASARRPQRPQSNSRVEQVSGGDNASVNELALVNKSGKKLLLLAGEVIVGGKQDRIVQEDRIIPPVSVPVALNVFCVEHGRWSANTASHGGGGGGGVAAPSVEAPAPAKFSSLGAVAHPKLRGAAQDKKEQSAVWSEVRANNAKLGTQNNTDTYKEVYASKKVSAQADDYIRALEREVMQPGVVGVVVARGGRLVWADLFASSALFSRYWPKLLKSYVVDALGDDASEKRPTVEEAARYLQGRDGTVSTTTQAGVYQLVKTEHPAYALFELRDISLAAPLRLHYNKMDR